MQYDTKLGKQAENNK